VTIETTQRTDTGYDQYLRATSVPEGQEVTPLSADEQLVGVSKSHK
jgi:hypothetical protein